ncbi:MAG: GNAT family N-acetyltransferase [Actinobacteria bacterium]|nr:GNAT family N-acetyltransferase [Actinomycetota bacterium]
MPPVPFTYPPCKPPTKEEVGKKVSVRLHDPEGGFRDILGILESETSIRRKNGLLVEFEANQVAVWRIVVTAVAKAGRGAPLSLRIREIERVASVTWPAKEVEPLGDWLMRATGKFTRRANSVLALGNPGVDLDEALKRVVDFYKSRGLPPMIHVALPTYAELDEKLEQRGWIGDVHAQVMVSDIEPELTNDSIFHGWEISDFPTQEWISLQNDEGVWEILKSAPARYAGLRIDSKLVAVGRGADSNGWTTLTRLFVKEEFRRQGIGQELVRQLLFASKADGIAKAFLQVDLKNVSAIRLYESLGFRPHHTYMYRALQQRLANG